MFRLFLTALLGISLAACGASKTPQYASIDETEMAQGLPKIFTEPPAADLTLISIRLIKCGDSSGTAFYIDPKGIFVTADHVSNGGDCTDVLSGQPMKTYYRDQINDFALLTSDTKGDVRVLKYNCDGFKPGKTYYSFGFARGYNFVMYKMVATNLFTGKDFIIKGKPHIGLRELDGVLIPGESGGPVFDPDNFEVVGINNATIPWDKGFSRELKDTILCKG